MLGIEYLYTHELSLTKKFTTMKHIRMMIIALLAVGGAVVLAGEPIEQDNWFNVMLWKSLIGFGMWGVAALLHKAWEGQGLIPKDDYNDSWDE